ncbi:MAG: hypothetical protein K940chlam1_00265 [Candidatus Anoxychlamydiales bacterium]|nr:hypothetical protein [Candidatus Anoxychlamydiales bacterium]NGX35587.1 hypothetical protein [Candidatus Anoxychlamydiales bacterium]
MSVSGMVSFTLTQDILDNPEQYPTLLINKLSNCSICMDEFSAEEIILASNACRHYFHHDELLKWVDMSPKKAVHYSTTIRLKPSCPNCKIELNAENITKLTQEEVLAIRTDPIEDESSKEEEISDATSDLNELEKEPLVNKPPNPNYSKEKLHKVVKIAAIITLAAALIFLSAKVLQS